MRKFSSRPMPLRSRMRGLSLIELMVALALGLFLMAGLFALVASNSSIRDELDKASRQAENGRFALQKMSEDIKNAGFYGDFYNLPVPTAMPAPCSTSLAGLQAGLALPVQGYADVSSAVRTASLPCIPAADFVVGTNVLVVRFASPQIVAGMADGWTAVGTVAAGQIYLQSNVDTALFVGGGTGVPIADDFSLTNNSAAGSPKAPVYRYITRIYFLGPCGRFAAGATTCTAGADGGTPIPSLRMVELEAKAAGAQFSGASMAVANGIEVLEFDYGVDSSGSASSVSGALTRDPTFADLANTVAVRISLLARNSEVSGGYVDDKTYVLGSNYPLASPYTPADTRFKRHQFQMTVRVANTSMRREL
jgi:type IV pilus assembly protein PilW